MSAARLMVAAPLALLASCGEGENAPGPGGVTAGEARALDDAAKMLDERRVPDEVLRVPPSQTPVPLPPR